MSEAAGEGCGAILLASAVHALCHALGTCLGALICCSKEPQRPEPHLPEPKRHELQRQELHPQQPQQPRPEEPQEQHLQQQPHQHHTGSSSTLLVGAEGRGEDVEAAAGGKSQQHEEQHPIHNGAHPYYHNQQPQPHQQQHHHHHHHHHRNQHQHQHQHQHQQEEEQEEEALALVLGRGAESIPQTEVAHYPHLHLQHYKPYNARSPEQQHPAVALHADPVGVPGGVGIGMGMGVGLAPRRFLGQFELLETLGKGASGKVKKARHVVTGQEVALKIINKSKAMKQAGKRTLLQLRTEIVALKALRHPNILELFHVEINAVYLKKSGVQVPSVVLALELAKGGELFDTIMYSGHFPEPVARTVFRQLLSTLKYCHERNIFHRDIKLENLLLDDNFQLKIADFGLAAIRADPTDLLKTECGTPSYMAPEMFLHEGGYDGGKADVWSAGVVLFMLLSGNPPFQQARRGDWWFDVLAVEGDVEKFWQAHLKHAPHIPQTAQSILTAVFIPDPALRPSSTELLDHPWMTGPTLTAEELYQEMLRRREYVQREKEQEKAMAIVEKLKQMEALAMAQAFAQNSVESRETASMGYEMGPGVGGISGCEDGFLRYQMSLYRSHNAQQPAAEDEGRGCLSPWQRLLLTRTDPVLIGEMVMQERYRIFREGRLDHDKALTILRGDQSHIILTGSDVTWGLMGWTAKMLKLGAADLEPTGLQSLRGTEAVCRAFILERRGDPLMKPAALQAIEEFQSLNDEVHPCYISVRSEYGIFSTVNAAFRRLITGVGVQAGIEQYRMIPIYVFASFLHPEDRRELCRASAECLIAKDPPLHITTILRFYERPGKTSLKIVTLHPLKPPLHGVATRIEPYPPPPASRGAAAGWKRSLTEVPSGSGQGKRPAPLPAPARGHPLPSTTAAPAPATGLAADFSTHLSAVRTSRRHGHWENWGWPWPPLHPWAVATPKRWRRSCEQWKRTVGPFLACPCRGQPCRRRRRHWCRGCPQRRGASRRKGIWRVRGRVAYDGPAAAQEARNREEDMDECF